jgi:hypothetical protein
MVEAGDTVHFGTRQVEEFRQHRHGGLIYIAEGFLEFVQGIDQGTGLAPECFDSLSCGCQAEIGEFPGCD